MNGDYTERVSQEGQRDNEEEGGILESASAFAQRVLEEIETLAGTTACKEVQLVRHETKIDDLPSRGTVTQIARTIILILQR